MRLALDILYKKNIYVTQFFFTLMRTIDYNINYLLSFYCISLIDEIRAHPVKGRRQRILGSLLNQCNKQVQQLIWKFNLTLKQPQVTKDHNDADKIEFKTAWVQFRLRLTVKATSTKVKQNGGPQIWTRSTTFLIVRLCRRPSTFTGVKGHSLVSVINSSEPLVTLKFSTM